MKIRIDHSIFFKKFCNKVIASEEILCASEGNACDSKLHLLAFKYSIDL